MHPTRILIIDDNPANLELAKYLLEAHGYSALTASDGAEGVRMAREKIPDLILCDLQMPSLDGYGVLSEIRSDPALSDTLVVAVTVFSWPANRARVLASGFDGYVTKPLDPEAFVQEVEAFLRPELRAVRRVPDS
jgi:CheY-like chemotaxis protein